MITCRGHTGPACSYSPCSSTREHREALFRTDPYGLPVARVGVRAPALRSRVEEAGGPAGGGGGRPAGGVSTAPPAGPTRIRVIRQRSSRSPPATGSTIADPRG